jgi:pyruvate-formate lyase
MKFDFPTSHSSAYMLALRRDILDYPLTVCLHRAETYTRVYRENEGAPWQVTKALAFAEHLRTVALFVRDHDRLAGSIAEAPGGMNLNVEIGFCEEAILLSERPEYRGYLEGKVPEDIREYWMERNLWGRYRAFLKNVLGQDAQWTPVGSHPFNSYNGHLSPSYRELLASGLGGLLRKVKDRRAGEDDMESREFLAAAEYALQGVSDWIERYGDYLRREAANCSHRERAAELAAMSEVAFRVATEPPETFREAMQLVWFVHQAIHIEGHGYSNTPDRIDQILYPYYRADMAAGRLTDDEALTLCENFVLKMRDNTFWSVAHNLTQGLCVGGSTPCGADQTNELSWLFIKASDAMAVPDPLTWIRWHENIDEDFFDFCVETLGGKTCVPLMMGDNAVPAMYMNMGVSAEDAYDYVPVGCNEIGIPGKLIFRGSGAATDVFSAIERAMTGGRGFEGRRGADPNIPDVPANCTFDEFLEVLRGVVTRDVWAGYRNHLPLDAVQSRWGQTPFTSCFFDGCIEAGRDMSLRTKYDVRAAGGGYFANTVDALAAIREVVFEKREATLSGISEACAANFRGYERLRAKLLAAPKHGNDDPRLIDIVDAVERLTDEPFEAVSRTAGYPIGKTHIVRSNYIIYGSQKGATPDGRLAGTPMASSVAASHGMERNGPTALINSLLAMHPARSWRCGVNVNIRMHPSMLLNAENRVKTRQLLEHYFRHGGQEMQINSVDSAVLRAAQADPHCYRDLVVRVAGFSAIFVDLSRETQETIIERTEHAL